MNERRNSLEDLLARLEEIVKEMSDETLHLNTALEKYEEGIRLYKECRQILDETKLKVELIKKENETESYHDI